MPQWKPGTLKGKALKVRYTVPVAFKLDGLSKEVSSGKSDTRLLRPAPRKIPNGERISPALLSIKTANDCYPLSTTEVKITVTNYSRQEYTCGNDYSIAYYAPDKRRWEALPVSPTFEDVGWVVNPQYPVHQQTIRLYTSEVPNRPGKYRIYKSFNRDTLMAYAEFELVHENKDR